ncbi:hypothetical protein [Nonomuraea sp. NPDC003709]|uniref:hypothetical protein n=1 Tax=Nonomuraea sp. NPDC003709 TaxID=3154450 RepID=UPI00339F9D88
MSLNGGRKRPAIAHSTAAALVVVAGLTGCAPTSPARYGAVGVSVNDEGDPVVALTWCGAPPDSITIRPEQKPNTSPAADDVGRGRMIIRSTKPLTGDLAYIDLRHPPDGWFVSVDVKKKPLTGFYSVDAWSSERKTALWNAEFDAASLKDLRTGRILRTKYSSETKGAVDFTMSESEFRAYGLSSCPKE